MLVAGLAFAQNARIVLRWKEVPGAAAYELQIARDAAFVEVVLQTRTTTAGYRWEQLPTTTHWWRVRSIDAESRPSEWSAPRTIAVDSAIPTGKRPEDGAALPCGATVEFELEASPLVKEYQVELSASADFGGLRTLRSPTPAMTAPGLATGTWWWRTRGVDVKGRTSGPGPVRSFSIRVLAPRLKAVGDVALGTPQVQLGWSEVGCAKGYLVEATHDGRDRVAIPSAGPSLAFKAGAAGEYRWRAAGVDERGAPGDFSAEGVFRVRLPAPQPKSEVVTTRADLTWLPVPTATAYRVEVARPGAKRAEGPLGTTVAGTAWRTPELAPGAWQWRVTARDALGHASAPSEWRPFTRAAEVPLDVPVLEEPADGLVVAVGDGALEVAWRPVRDATRYEVEVDGVALPAVPVGPLRTAPLAEGAHRVRVRALGASFRVSEWSALHEVYVGVPPVARAEVQVLGEAVRVRLLDGRGRPVAGARPAFSVRAGSLGAPELRDGAWLVPWSPPASGDDVLVVRERAFVAEQRVMLAAAAWLSVAARGGGQFNGGSVASPSGVLGVTVRLPPWQRRLGLELRAGVYGAEARLPVAGGVLAGRVLAVPVSLLAAWHQDAGPVQLKVGVGPALQVLQVAVGPDAEVGVRPGLELVVGLGRRLGPGRVEVEAGLLYSRYESSLARLDAGGLGLRVGYAFDFFGGG